MIKEEEIISLQNMYNKILFVDFETGEYRVWKLPPNEKDKPRSNKIKDYWMWFCNESGLLHPNDVDNFIEFTKHPLELGHCCYKRLIDNEWRQAIMEVHANDIGKTHILAVKDITKIYEVEKDRIKSIDEMTGCLNQYAFFRDIDKYAGGNVGVIFADINCLKFINDTTKSHAEGDKLILKFVQQLKDRFSDCRIYRRGGDEFIVIATDIKLRHFLSRARTFHKELWRGHDDNEFPIASIGFSVDIEAIEEVVAQAEEEMYYDKKLFKKFYPKYKR